MTTARSPLRILTQQANRIAKALKQAERGEPIANDPGGKIAASLARGAVKFAVVMDDKVISIEMPWTLIRETSERGISEYVLQQMKEARDAIN